MGVETTGLDECDRPRQSVTVAAEQLFDGSVGGKGEVAGGDHGVDHPDETEALPVLRGEDAGHPVCLELADLVGHDHAAATTEHLHMAVPLLAQAIHQVLEVLDVTPLVGGHGNPLHVFVDDRRDDFVDGTVVAEMDDLHPTSLEDPAHDVDRRVVTVEQARRRDEPHGVLGDAHRWYS